ncbi:cytochrome bc1 complex cytochrome b subunit [Sphaerisporangium fuscum]|uniref:cytochrome bc1 complex cytochrome b subunit n=1 Tax=Sphaerisporangium fuscum TaxID=2835868 RepID=UPI001BDD4481|nr:ubiquinol-cytochrome c reductase cytochrome b subunit [Sphaerisporangium fuscum]
MIIRRLARRAMRTLDARLRIAPQLRLALAKVFPDHWTFMIGEIALYCFAALVATGVFLTLFFDPSPADRVYGGAYGPFRGVTLSAAYASAVELSWDVRAGLLMRQAHHWAALVFLGAIVVHLSRVFFTGAFRKPREINWVIGVTMFLLALATGFAGYSMPDDLLSGTGLRVASGVMLSIPLAGPWLAFLFFGGEFPGEPLIPRLYILHVLILPGLIAALVGAHLAIIVRQKHSQFPGLGRNEHNVVGSKLWPTYSFRSLALLCAVFAVLFGLGGLAQINPVWVWGPFHPDAVTSPAQPDWYLSWVDGALRLFPPLEFRVFGYLVPAPFLPGVVFPALTFLVVYAWPWLERRVTGDRGRHQLLDRPRDRPGRVALGAWALSFLGLLLAASSNDVVARQLHIPVLNIMYVMRLVVLVVPLVVAGLAYVLARALRAHPHLTLLTLRPGHLTPARLRPSPPAGPPAGSPEPRPAIPAQEAPEPAERGGGGA